MKMVYSHFKEFEQYVEKETQNPTLRNSYHLHYKYSSRNLFRIMFRWNE